MADPLGLSNCCDMFAQFDSVTSVMLIGAVALLGLALFWVAFRQKRELATVREALRGSDGRALEHILLDHIRSRQLLQDDVAALRSRVAELERQAETTVGRVGLVRYDAFEEMGGDQSFALAFQNQRGDGVVFNSIAGRQQVKLYCKPIREGSSDVSLTPEETAAIELAHNPHYPPEAATK